MYRPEVMSLAVWNRSLSYFFHAASSFSPFSLSEATGAVKRPSSLMAIKLSQVLLWKRLNMIRMTPTPGGMPNSLLSAKESALSLPSLPVRIESCIFWLLP